MSYEILLPGVDYRSMNRADTNTVAQNEAAWYEAMLQSDGFPVEFDILVDDPDDPDGPQILLKSFVRRDPPPKRPLEKGDGKPALQEPNRTVDVFLGPASLIGVLPPRGRTMKYNGQTFTVFDVKPRAIADVPYAVEIHVDVNSGLFTPNPLGGRI